ncbi:uncharacterized protein BJX67DRAFT_324374 [Aspergillus lucknowensis]|uniref:Uncharacterized protein n=1 Tax=Aspergillus lucknowensis TaxID=176173 RepID=A0ABR4M0D5_9EURO
MFRASIDDVCWSVGTVANEIRPPNSPRLMGLRRTGYENLPSPQRVRVYAVVAALLLGRSSLGYEWNDCYHLLATLLIGTWSNDPSLLAELREEELYPSELRAYYQSNPPSDPARWHAVKTTSLVPAALSRTAVKTLKFPDDIPEIKSDWQYVHIFKPHANPPTSRMQCSIWGKHTAGPNQQTWDSVLVIADHKMCEVYRHILHEIGAHTAQPFWTEQSHDWVQSLEYLYVLGINSARLLVREAVESLKQLKYRNIADGDSGALHSCLVYAEHLSYHRRLIDSIRDELEDLPIQWRVTKHTPSWTDSIRDSCCTAEKEITKAHKEAVDLRKLACHILSALP